MNQYSQCDDCGHEFKVSHLVNGICSTCRYYEKELQDTMFDPPDIYLNVCDCEPEQCKKIEGKCKNLAYR